MECALCHHSGTYNFEVTFIFMKYLSTPASRRAKEIEKDEGISEYVVVT
jgi:hypothetical protein